MLQSMCSRWEIRLAGPIQCVASQVKEKRPPRWAACLCSKRFDKLWWSVHACLRFYKELSWASHLLVWGYSQKCRVKGRLRCLRYRLKSLWRIDLMMFSLEQYVDMKSKLCCVPHSFLPAGGAGTIGSMNAPGAFTPGFFGSSRSVDTCETCWGACVCGFRVRSSSLNVRFPLTVLSWYWEGRYSFRLKVIHLNSLLHWTRQSRTSRNQSTGSDL